MSDSPAHILLIEDDTAIRELMETVLTDEGYVVTTSTSPQRSLPLFDLGTFDMVITDGFSRIPDKVMASTADVIRSAGMTPVVLFTAHPIDLASTRAAGFHDLISKPFDLSALILQVKALLDG